MWKLELKLEWKKNLKKDWNHGSCIVASPKELYPRGQPIYIDIYIWNCRK